MQKHCPYCQFENQDHGKDFLVQLGNTEEHLYIAKYKNQYYLDITTNDSSDSINGLQERSSMPINHCPICGNTLKKTNSGD